MMTLTDDPFFSTHLKSKIEAASNHKFAVQRVYANGQTFGQDGTFHQDDKNDESYTFCLYTNKQITAETADDIGGEFIFKVPKSDSNPNELKDDPFESPLRHYTIEVSFFPQNIFTKGLHSTGTAKGSAFPSRGNFKKYEKDD